VFKFFSKRSSAALAALAVAAVAGVGAYAFTAQNSVPNEIAGAGTATVGHFTATQIGYTFAADTTTVDAMAFNLNHPASDVAVDLEASGATPAAGNYKDCGAAVLGGDAGNPTLYHVTCTGLGFLNGGDQDLYIAAVTSGHVLLD
jgi:hypothetical protein